MKSRWWVLSVTTSSLSLIFFNSTAVPVALPTIANSLGFHDVGLEWVVNAYLLALMAFVLVAGRLGDMFGLRRILCWGLGLFAFASILCAFTPTKWWLITARSLQGVGAAAMLPPSGALLIRTFPKELRGKAVGFNVCVSSLFLILGPLISGFFTEYFNWRYLFWLNVPIALFGLTMALILIEPQPRKEERFDFLGALSLGAGSLGLIVALMQGDDWGWTSATTFICFFSGLLFLIFFGKLSMRKDHPLADLTLFRDPIFRGALICQFCTQALVMVNVFWAVYFQERLGFSPMLTGGLFLVAHLPVALMAPVAGHLGDRLGPKIPITAGFSLIIFCQLWLAFFASSDFLFLLLPLIAFGMGVPLIFSPSFTAAMGRVAPHKLGAATGVSLGMRQFAATSGMAMLSALYVSLAPPSKAFAGINLLAAALALIGLLSAVRWLPHGRHNL